MEKRKKCVEETEPSSGEQNKIPHIQVKAFLINCNGRNDHTSKHIRDVSTSQNEDTHRLRRHGKDVPFQHTLVTKCKKKVIVTLILNNKGKTSCEEEFILVDHIIDPQSHKRLRLLYPYVIKVRQEQVLQLYGLKFMNMVNGKAREKVINKGNPAFTGCDDSPTSTNPTCGCAYSKESIVPFSQGFCCSCDAAVNSQRQLAVMSQAGSFTKSNAIQKPMYHSKRHGIDSGASNSMHRERHLQKNASEKLRQKMGVKSHGKERNYREKDRLIVPRRMHKRWLESSDYETEKTLFEISTSYSTVKETTNSIDPSNKNVSILNPINRSKLENFLEYNNQIIPKVSDGNNPSLLQSVVQEVDLLRKLITGKFNALNGNIQVSNESDIMYTSDVGLDYLHRNTSPRKSNIYLKYRNKRHSEVLETEPEVSLSELSSEKRRDAYQKYLGNDKLFYNKEKDYEIKSALENLYKESISSSYNHNRQIHAGDKNVDDEERNNSKDKNISGNRKWNGFEKLIRARSQAKRMHQQNYHPSNAHTVLKSLNCPNTYSVHRLNNYGNQKLGDFERLKTELHAQYWNSPDWYRRFLQENVYLGKRQTSSITQQRGGQNCSDKSTPPNVDPNSYHDSAHCLQFSDLWYSVYRLEKPFLEHNVYLQVFEKINEQDGKYKWNDLTEGILVKVGTSCSQAMNELPTMSFTYSSIQIEDCERFDLNYSKMRLLVPEPVPRKKKHMYPQLQSGPSEYLVLTEDQISTNGKECDKAGVGYEAFVKQPDRCCKPRGSCLKNQPIDFWRKDIKARVDGKKGHYFLENFGTLPKESILTNVSSKEEFLGMEYYGRYTARIDMEISADLNAVVEVGYSGRITDVYVDGTHKLCFFVTVFVTNTGPVSSGFLVRLKDFPPQAPPAWAEEKSDIVQIPPDHTNTFQLQLKGPHDMDNFHCSVELVNDDYMVLATRRIRFQTNSRCLCVWYCLCACIDSGNGLGCLPMSQENYNAAGFQGSLTTATSSSNDWILILFILLVFLCFLLLLGAIKGILGLCWCPRVGTWGLDVFVDQPRQIPHYYERELYGRTVIYDCAGFPVHPDTKLRSVRTISRGKEFFLNTIFFFLCPSCILCCHRYCIFGKRAVKKGVRCETINWPCSPGDEGSSSLILKDGYEFNFDDEDYRMETADTNYVVQQLKRSQVTLMRCMCRKEEKVPLLHTGSESSYGKSVGLQNLSRTAIEAEEAMQRLLEAEQRAKDAAERVRTDSESETYEDNSVSPSQDYYQTQLMKEHEGVAESSDFEDKEYEESEDGPKAKDPVPVLLEREVEDRTGDDLQNPMKYGKIRLSDLERRAIEAVQINRMREIVKSTNADVDHEEALKFVDRLHDAYIVFRNLDSPIGGVQIPHGVAYCIRGFFVTTAAGYRFTTQTPLLQYWIKVDEMFQQMEIPKALERGDFEVDYLTPEEVFLDLQLSERPVGHCINVLVHNLSETDEDF